MLRKLITCPETAHLEEIGYETHSLGVLIVECSRFSPACEVACPRTCAARMDASTQPRRGRRDTERADLAPTGTDSRGSCAK